MEKEYYFNVLIKASISLTDCETIEEAKELAKKLIEENILLDFYELELEED